MSRHFGTTSTAEDTPTAPGVTLDSTTGDYAGTSMLMAVFGEPLDAMVQNLGQTDNGYVSVGGATNRVLSQGFATGSNEFGYRLQGIGVNIEGSNSNSNAQVPDDSVSVSAAVHADSGGKPGAKLFDLVSPTQYAAGHSFLRRRRERIWRRTRLMCWCGATTAAPGTGCIGPRATARTRAR
ncbi:choice-of-anchor R domain-containing protein [Candidatus Poriferisodalis sp.]|uniref:choice-of-anchor R domain-containing protein n=1 Tax=Candidatus Poriferisodalis sp. TaxID=3101277 RepID=UPI003C6FFA53